MNKLVSEEFPFHGRRFDVVKRTYENSDGKLYSREIVKTPSASIVLAIDEEDNVIFVEQLREAIEKNTLELPAGLVEENEDPKSAAIRELREETGYVVKDSDVTFLTSVYTSCGFTDEKIYIYVAKNITRGETSFDEDENIEKIIKIPFSKVLEMAKNSELEQANQNVAILLYNLKK